MASLYILERINLIIHMGISTLSMPLRSCVRRASNRRCSYAVLVIQLLNNLSFWGYNPCATSSHCVIATLWKLSQSEWSVVENDFLRATRNSVLLWDFFEDENIFRSVPVLIKAGWNNVERDGFRSVMPLLSHRFFVGVNTEVGSQ